MDITFISVNFRSAAALGRSLESLTRAFQGTALRVEYIIVNNDVTEHAAIEALACGPLKPRIIHAPENIGFGQANMLGSQSAQGEILFFLNPDTIFLSGNFFGLIAALRYRPRAIYGMALEGRRGLREPWSAGLFPSLGALFRANVGAYPRPCPWQAQTLHETDWVSGAALAIRKDFFDTLDGFDQCFFLYFEDVDLARQAKERGGVVGVYPFLRFFHAGGESHASISVQKQYFYQSQLRFFLKWRPWYESAVLLLAQKFLGYR